MDSDIVYLNGEFMPLEAGARSTRWLDRGFIFSATASTKSCRCIHVIRSACRPSIHRLAARTASTAIRLGNPLPDTEWTVGSTPANSSAATWATTSRFTTRSRAARPSARHEFPLNVKQTVFMMSNPLVTLGPLMSRSSNGAHFGITATDFRWLKCDLKSVSLLGNCLLKQMAVDAGAAEVVMFRDGYLTEASASNVFIVKNGVLLAPPKNHLDPARHHVRRRDRNRPKRTRSRPS